MADNNNALAGKLPKTPHPALRKLDPLIGVWQVDAPNIEGTLTFEWMEGGFFMIQRFDLTDRGVKIRGIEYTGFDEDTQTLRSRLMDINGANFTYTWDVEGDEFWYWFGDKGSDNFSHGRFSEDGNTIYGRWQWPNPDGTTGGYEYRTYRIG